MKSHSRLTRAKLLAQVQDLHDGLCQELAGIELMCQVLEQKLRPKSRAEAKQAWNIADHLRSAITDTRKLARGLSPVELESNGFILKSTPELIRHAMRWSESSHIQG